MTYPELIDEDLIAALRSDAQARPPRGARERVMNRVIVSAGALGATATLSAGAGAGALGATGLLASHSTVVLLSTLALGVGLGFGGHSALDHAAERSARAARATTATQAPPAAVTPARTVSPRSVPPPAAPTAESAPEPLPPDPVPASPTRAATREAAAPPQPPRPTAPAEPAPVVSVGLAAQQALLDDARAALVRGDGGAALALVDAHRLRFPDTALGEERSALEIRALVSLGRRNEARRRLGGFEASFPRSLFLPALRAAVGADDSVTGTVGRAQVGGEVR